MDDQRVHDGQADKSPNHGGDGGQQLHQHFQGLAGLAGGELTDIDGSTERKRNGHQHGESGHTRGTRDQRKYSVGGFPLGGRAPFGRGEEFDEIESSEDKLEALSCDEHKDPENEHDHRDPTDEHQDLNRLVDVPSRVTMVAGGLG